MFRPAADLARVAVHSAAVGLAEVPLEPPAVAAGAAWAAAASAVVAAVAGCAVEEAEGGVDSVLEEK